MNRLKYTRAYSCGAMDRVPDGGEGWRKQIRKDLDDLDILWLDPTCKPIAIALEDKESRKRRHNAKMRDDFDIVADEMGPIRDVDMRMVNICDFLVVNINIEVHACGTYFEFKQANDQNKPILVHVEQGKRACPDWILGEIPHEHIFGTWGDLHKYIRHVAHDPVIDHLGRWMFFNWQGDSNEEKDALI